jgi:hypothetical protein
MLLTGVPEIRASLDTISKLLGQMSVSESDRSLVFPMCLAGCLSDDPSQRELFKGRLQAQDGNGGTVMQARLLLETSWQRRNVHGGMLDWRELMHDQGMNLLLI